MDAVDMDRRRLTADEASDEAGEELEALLALLDMSPGLGPKTEPGREARGDGRDLDGNVAEGLAVASTLVLLMERRQAAETGGKTVEELAQGGEGAVRGARTLDRQDLGAGAREAAQELVGQA